MSTIRPRSPRSYALAAPAILWMLGALVVPTLLIVVIDCLPLSALSNGRAFHGLLGGGGRAKGEYAGHKSEGGLEK